MTSNKDTRNSSGAVELMGEGEGEGDRIFKGTTVLQQHQTGTTPFFSYPWH